MVDRYWGLEIFGDREPELSVAGGSGKEKDFFGRSSHGSVHESEVKQPRG